MERKQKLTTQTDSPGYFIAVYVCVFFFFLNRSFLPSSIKFGAFLWYRFGIDLKKSDHTLDARVFSFSVISKRSRKKNKETIQSIKDSSILSIIF